MQLSSKKGFLLLDSLITVFVTSVVCVMCYMIFSSIVNYDEGYIEYQKRSNSNLEYIYNNLFYCEECEIDESD